MTKSDSTDNAVLKYDAQFVAILNFDGVQGGYTTLFFWLNVDSIPELYYVTFESLNKAKMEIP